MPKLFYHLDESTGSVFGRPETRIGRVLAIEITAPEDETKATDKLRSILSLNRTGFIEDRFV